MEETKEEISRATNDEMELEEFRIKGLNEALELTKEKDEKVRPIVEDLYETLSKRLNEEDDFDILDAFSTLSKVSLYFTQSYFNSKDEFDEEYKVARQLVTENILQSLGINADDEVKNINSVVTFNGEPDLENFSLRRILMIASQITEYALWQLTLTKTFDKLSSQDIELAIKTQEEEVGVM